MNTTEAMTRMLENLDIWRHLPKYQMERRADLFFSLFIKEIVQASKFTEQKQLSEVIIPEFPYKNNDDRHTTVNFDYVLFSENFSSVYIIELKTDSNSAGDVNNSYLDEFENNEVTFTDIINGLLDVAKKTKYKNKYNYLFKILEHAGIIENYVNDGWKCKIKIGKPKIIYLSPGMKKSDGKKRNLIDFHQAADTLENIGGEIEKQFAIYLRKWQDTNAGA